MPMHRFRKWILDWGGGGGAQTFAQLKSKNVFGSQRKSLTLDIIIQFLQLVLCYGVTFSGV